MTEVRRAGLQRNSAAGALVADQLAVGQEVMSRSQIQTNAAPLVSSGSCRLSFFTATKSETSTQVRVYSGATAAGATPTLVRVGLYAVASDGAGTLVAATPNDTALLASTNTGYTKSWSTPYAVVSGQRYAMALLVVSGATVPTMAGSALIPASESAMSPRITGQISGQSDLPASFTDAGLTGSSTRIYAAILP